MSACGTPHCMPEAVQDELVMLVAIIHGPEDLEDDRLLHALCRPCLTKNLITIVL